MRFRRNFSRYFFVAGILLLALVSFSRVSYADTEAIDNFDVRIAIQKDGAVLVREVITYNFGANQKHGIFRDIPLTAADGPQLDITVSSVADEAGRSYQYVVSDSDNIFHIKIGDPNILVSGIKTYVIDYQVYNAVRTFSGRSEFYWNVTGNQWPVEIRKAVASVTSPGSSASNARMDCFTGSQGSTQRNCSFNSGGGFANYSITRPLNIKEGLTIVFGIPLGYIDNIYIPPSAPPQSYNDDTRINSQWFLITFVLGAITILLIYRAARKKPRPIIPRELRGQSVVIEYNPPDNLSPIETGTLLDRRVDSVDISSIIIDLAIRGYLKIHPATEQIKSWPDKRDFELMKLKDGTDLRSADKRMFDLLFDGRNSVKLSDLKQFEKTPRTVKRIKTDIKRHLQKEGYLKQVTEDGSRKFNGFLLVTIAVLITFFILDDFQKFFFLLIPIVIFTFIISLIKNFLKSGLTPRGLAAVAKILGFRKFLQLTEKDKLEFLNAPELQPEMFEKFLPYAMVLGVEDKWAKKFENIYKTSPVWYENPTISTFNSYVLIGDLSLFSGSFNHVFDITSLRSGSRFSSGFSGGFSGGGSGGGGGSSW